MKTLYKPLKKSLKVVIVGLLVCCGAFTIIDAQNPANSYLHIRKKNKEWSDPYYSLELIGIDGKTQYKESVQSEKLHTDLKIDVRHLSSGIYMIRINNGEKLYSKKFVKN